MDTISLKPPFLPLEGVVVVAVEQAVSAPLATCRLADAGARVIKVERPEGDFARYYDTAVKGMSTYFVWANRGKESIRLDFDDPQQRGQLLELIADADVFVQNLAPGALERRGLDSASLRKLHPKLVTCDISGYGPDGPYAGMKAYDNLIQAESGLFDVTGNGPERSKVGISVADISAGMHAYAAVLEALLQRARTGEGTGIHVAMFDCMADWMMVPWLHHEYGGSAPPRSGLAHAAIAPYGVFVTSDGVELMIGLQNEREWLRFCKIVLENAIHPEDGRYASNSLRLQNRAEMDAVIAKTVGSLSAEQATKRLDEARIAWAHVNSVADLSSHPHLRLVDVQTPNGAVKLADRPARFHGHAPTPFGPVP